jgi:hypothetical protein
MFGGGEVSLLGVEITSYNWRRPSLAAVAALVCFLWLNRTLFAAPRAAWGLSVAIGAAVGVYVFLWIYLGAYLERRGFPEEQLLAQLKVSDPSGWTGPFDVLRDLRAYDTWRPFLLVLILAALALTPWFGVAVTVRRHWAWLVGFSCFVLLIPIRFPDFSLWRVFIEPLPGFGVIRAPKRIIYIFELAVALAAGLFVAHLGPRARPRLFITLLVLSLMAFGRPYRFQYERSIADFDRWVEAPIVIDPACRSFYINGASDAYMARSNNMWAQYSVDTLFIALRHRIPTLNGYSAWFPKTWLLHTPQEPGYDEAVQQWIDRNGLTGVCELDIDARTMTPRG